MGHTVWEGSTPRMRPRHSRMTWRTTLISTTPLALASAPSSATTLQISTTASWNEDFCIPVGWVQPTTGGATTDGGLHPPYKERNRTRKRDCRSWVKSEQGRGGRGSSSVQRVQA